MASRGIFGVAFFLALLAHGLVVRAADSNVLATDAELPQPIPYVHVERVTDSPKEDPADPIHYVEDLHPETFFTALQSQREKAWIVFFYVPNSPPCQFFAHTLAQFALKLHSRGNFQNIQLAKMNIEDEGAVEIKEKFHIIEYPTVLALRPSVINPSGDMHVTKMQNSDRTLATLFDFVHEYLTEHVRVKASNKIAFTTAHGEHYVYAPNELNPIDPAGLQDVIDHERFGLVLVLSHGDMPLTDFFVSRLPQWLAAFQSGSENATDNRSAEKETFLAVELDCLQHESFCMEENANNLPALRALPKGWRKFIAFKGDVANENEVFAWAQRALRDASPIGEIDIDDMADQRFVIDEELGTPKRAPPPVRGMDTDDRSREL